MQCPVADNHHLVVGTNEVWANYQALSHPDNKYVHVIEERNGAYRCVVKADSKLCWENCIRGLPCSHIICYIVKTVLAGGEVDFRFVGNTCLPRYRLSQSEVEQVSLPAMTEPDFDNFTLPKLTPSENVSIFGIMDLVRECVRRGGSEILEIMRDLMQHRLLGCGPGRQAHRLVDEFMTCVRITSARVTRAKRLPRPVSPIYANNPRDRGNRQNRRDYNRGDEKALSTGFKKHQMLAAKAAQVNLTLSGFFIRADTFCITLKKARALGLVDKGHKVFYMNPFTAPQPHQQRRMLHEAGLLKATLVGFDLEWGGPRYPTKRKRKGVIYDASLAVFSCATGS